MARVKHMQIVIAVGLVLVLAYMFYLTVIMAGGIIRFNAHFLRDARFWRLAIMGLALYGSLFGLIHSAAAAQISFSSENRSTPLRRWMLLQQAIFCGFIGASVYQYRDGGVLELITNSFMIAAGYWYLMGTLLTSEWPHLSRRVQRSLPDSAAGRVFLSFFNPGPGAGYAFALANLAAIGTAAIIIIVVWGNGPAAVGWPIDRSLYFIILGFSYAAAFLGFGRVAIAAARRWAYVPMSAGFLLHLILLLTGVGIPTVVQLMSRELRSRGYSLIQMTNPFWTLSELLSDGPDAVQAPILLTVIPGAAIFAFALNFRSVAAELARQRIAVPLRIVEDELEIRAAQPLKSSSPWDEEELSPPISSQIKR
jgi:hypothetical protein